MEETHYCIECAHSKKVYVESMKAIIDHLVCGVILSIATKEPGRCDLVRDGYKLCDKYEPANPKKGS